MSTDERYDEATVELVARFSGHAGDAASQARCITCKGWAREVLGALADAGLLLPPGGEKTTAVGHWSPHRGYLYECGGHNDECTWPIGGTFVETRWADGSRHIGPWTEVPDDPA